MNTIRFLAVTVCILGMIYQLPVEVLIWLSNTVVLFVMAGWLAKCATNALEKWLKK